MKAIIKNLDISPSKLRLVVRAIKGQHAIKKVMRMLMGINKKGSIIVKKAIDSAVANGEHNYAINKNNIYLKEIFVGDGPRRGFIDIKGRGRMGRIVKQRSTLTVILMEESDGTKD